MHPVFWMAHTSSEWTLLLQSIHSLFFCRNQHINHFWYIIWRFPIWDTPDTTPAVKQVGAISTYEDALETDRRVAEAIFGRMRRSWRISPTRNERLHHRKPTNVTISVGNTSSNHWFSLDMLVFGSNPWKYAIPKRYSGAKIFREGYRWRIMGFKLWSSKIGNHDQTWQTSRELPFVSRFMDDIDGWSSAVAFIGNRVFCVLLSGAYNFAFWFN